MRPVQRRVLDLIKTHPVKQRPMHGLPSRRAGRGVEQRKHRPAYDRHFRPPELAEHLKRLRNLPRAPLAPRNGRQPDQLDARHLQEYQQPVKVMIPPPQPVLIVDYVFHEDV